MLLDEEVIKILRDKGKPFTAEGLSKRINLHKSVLEYRFGKSERKLFESFKSYLKSMVEYKEINYRNEEGYSL